jgi:hypothetical protein
MVAIKNPIANLVLRALEYIIEKKQDGISNDSVIEIIKTSARSTWNDLDDEKVEAIINIINSKNEIQG